MAEGQRAQSFGEGHGLLYGYDEGTNVVRIDMSEVKFVPGLATSLV